MHFLLKTTFQQYQPLWFSNFSSTESLKNIKVNGVANNASMKNGINNFLGVKVNSTGKKIGKKQMVQLEWIGDLHLKTPAVLFLWSRLAGKYWDAMVTKVA